MFSSLTSRAATLLKKTPAHASSEAPATPGYLTERGRDLRIDFLRGYFVFAMVVDHVRGSSWLYAITGGNRFYTSAAEGFIFISGLVAGLVYRRLIERDGLGPSLRRVLGRAAQLYLLAVGLTLLFVPLSETFELPWTQGLELRSPGLRGSLEFIVSVFTLHRTYYLVDVPLLYALLFLVTPIALVLLSQGQSLTVLAISVSLWGLYQVFPDEAQLTWPIAGNYLFNFSAWQILFFVGLLMGYYRDRVGAVLGRLPQGLTLMLLTLGVAGLIGLDAIALRVVQALSPDPVASAAAHQQWELFAIEVLFGKADLRIGRLIASAIVFGFLFLLITRFWKPLNRAIGWLFLPLGQHALYAYGAHVLVTAGVAIALEPLELPRLGPAGLNATVQIASVMLIWLLVRFRVLAPTRSTQRRWMMAPAVLALVLLVLLPQEAPATQPGVEPALAESELERGRAARAFGTPIPRTGPAARPVAPRLPGAPAAPRAAPGPADAPDAFATPAPLPPPPAQPARPPGMEAAASPYIRDISGMLREFEFYSAALNADMRYFIYLPPDYASAGRRYPVLYMLHGAAGDKEEWLAIGLIDAADRAMRSEEVEPMVVVLPDGDLSYWANHARGPRWGDYVADDLVRHIDASYRTLAEPPDRAVGGLSMGAWGALHLAITRPDVFGTVGAHSPSLRTGDVLGFLGDEEEFRNKDPLALAQTADSIEDLQIWIDVGEDDPWLERAELLHNVLAERGIWHSWNVFPGGHDADYWQAHLLDYLRFYGSALARR